MATPAYVLGARLERQVADLLRTRRWLVARSAGSHGPFDLIALHDGQPPRLIQCKLHRHDVRQEEWARLWHVATTYGATPMLADRSGPRGYPRLYLITGSRPHRAPCDEYLLPMTWDE